MWTRTWYHTGAFFGADDIAARLAQEYWALDPQGAAAAVDDPARGASAEELREACRALRGQVLREEVYALDNTPAAQEPVCDDRVPLRGRHAPASAPVSRTAPSTHWERESRSRCHYERNPADPRVAHDLSLAIDAYGNLTRQASVGYPRRSPPIAEQAATLVSYGEADFTNVADQPDWYRLGLPVETRGYQLTGVRPRASRAGCSTLMTLGPRRGRGGGHPVRGDAHGTTVQRRMLARQRTYYRTTT